MLLAWNLECVAPAEAANEPWLAFPPRQEVTITRLGEYTRVVLTKFSEQAPVPKPAWA